MITNAGWLLAVGRGRSSWKPGSRCPVRRRPWRRAGTGRGAEVARRDRGARRCRTPAALPQSPGSSADQGTVEKSRGENGLINSVAAFQRRSTHRAVELETEEGEGPGLESVEDAVEEILPQANRSQDRTQPRPGLVFLQISRQSVDLSKDSFLSSTLGTASVRNLECSGHRSQDAEIGPDVWAESDGFPWESRLWSGSC